MSKENCLAGSLFGSLVSIGAASYPLSVTEPIIVIISIIAGILAIISFKIGITKYFEERAEAEFEGRKIEAENLEKLYELFKDLNDSSQKNMIESSNEIAIELKALQAPFDNLSQNQIQILEEVQKVTSAESSSNKLIVAACQQLKQIIDTLQVQFDNLSQNQTQILEEAQKVTSAEVSSNKLILAACQQQKQILDNIVTLAQNSTVSLEAKIKTIEKVNEFNALQKDLLKEMQILTKSDKSIPEAERLKFEENVQNMLNDMKEILSYTNEIVEDIKDINRQISDYGERHSDSLSEINDTLRDIDSNNLKSVRKTIDNLNDEVEEMNEKLPTAEERAEQINRIISDNWKQYETLTDRDIKLLQNLAGR